jgi:hypothetical protein
METETSITERKECISREVAYQRGKRRLIFGRLLRSMKPIWTCVAPGMKQIGVLIGPTRLGKNNPISSCLFCSQQGRMIRLHQLSESTMLRRQRKRL